MALASTHFQFPNQTAFYRGKVASHGGYVYYYSPDLKERWGEGKASPDILFVQPPGTPMDLDNWNGRPGHFTARLDDPRDSVFKFCPFVRDKSWIAFSQVFAKHRMGIWAHARRHQMPRKVRARNQIRITHIFERAFKRALDADFGQAIGNFQRSLAPAAWCSCSTS